LYYLLYLLLKIDFLYLLLYLGMYSYSDSNMNCSGVELIIEHLKSKSISCEFDFDNSYYFGGNDDVSYIITPLGTIKIIENAYTYNDNEIIMKFDDKFITGIQNIIQELDSMFNN